MIPESPKTIEELLFELGKKAKITIRNGVNDHDRLLLHERCQNGVVYLDPNTRNYILQQEGNSTAWELKYAKK